MAENGKTTTIVIHHAHCDPGAWTARDLINIWEFVRYGGAGRAKRLRDIGLQVVASEHHAPLGGTLEPLGFSAPIEAAETVDLEAAATVDALCDEILSSDPIGPTPVVQIYQGPIRYAVGIPIGDEDGCIEGYEFEFRDTEAEAQALADDIRKPAP